MPLIPVSTDAIHISMTVPSSAPPPGLPDMSSRGPIGTVTVAGVVFAVACQAASAGMSFGVTSGTGRQEMHGWMVKRRCEGIPARWKTASASCTPKVRISARRVALIMTATMATATITAAAVTASGSQRDTTYYIVKP
ncbi:hypothetical protein VTJ49DRAFT_6071 [Mycothermus thermophilus]|uniref:Uncharacterized protein n=1 Tax=Humicola insolens TaxID=85995 RepID=A0ABR3VJU5_HUMIN